MADHLSDVIVFVEVARAGSFTLAADRLGLTKSAVSKTISRLEERLGDRLLTRSTRRLALTASGDAYLASCVAALDILRDAEEALGGYEASPKGRLRMDMPSAFGRRVLVPLLADLCLAHPALQLTLSFTDRLIDPIEEGVDLVIRFGRTADTSGLVAKTLVAFPHHICASPAYLERRGTPEHLEDLDRHDCLVGSRRGAPLRWSVRKDGADVRISPPPTHQIEDGEAIIAMAVAGLGLCQMPAPLVRDQLASGALVPVLEASRGPDVPVQAVWPGTRQASPRVRFVVDRLAEHGRAGLLG
ncbi:LysR family transcriptional regulator [Roseomonas sp. GCM10028921]